MHAFNHSACPAALWIQNCFKQSIVLPGSGVFTVGMYVSGDIHPTANSQFPALESNTVL